MAVPRPVLINLPGGFERGADEGTGVLVLPQDTGEVAFFPPQAVLLSSDGSGSVKQAPDQSSLDLRVGGGSGSPGTCPCVLVSSRR